MKKAKSLQIKDIEIGVKTHKGNDDFSSLTDMAKWKNPEHPRFVIQNWMRTRFTIEFIGNWEILYNGNFNRVDFEAFRNEAGSNSFSLTPDKWIKRTNAIGLNHYGLKCHRFLNLTKVSSSQTKCDYSSIKSSLSFLDLR